ncbi:MAG: T9SS type A sorting domain-containing protein [Lentimicrobiaceae bacterium]|nr:T9SS type A sorting domain-containing protein [Lentimicrobiaceae bacterium]
MKKLALITFFVFSLILTNAQNPIPFPTENTTWEVVSKNMDFSTPTYFFEFAKTDGDTTINGQQYTIITRYEKATCFIREDNGLVYCKYSSDSPYDTTEFLLYNYNLEPGDTMLMTNTYFSNNFRYITAQVVQAEYILIGDTYRKKIRLFGNNYFDFVEGVGSLQGLLYTEIPIGGFKYKLTCFSVNDTIFSLYGDGYTNPGTCWEITDIKEPESSTITVSPNPTNNFIRINAPQISKAELFTINGQKILETTSQNINLMDYERGIYVLKVYSANKSVKIFKVVKQ